MDYRGRLRRLEQRLEDAGLDGLVITHLANVRYLCGFTGSSGVLVFAGNNWEFLTDGRYTEQARTEVIGCRIRVDARAPLLHAAHSLAHSFARTRRTVLIGIEAEHVTLAMQSRIRAELRRPLRKSIRLVPTNGLVEQFRITKDREEVRQLRQAVQLASSIFPDVIQ